MSLFKSEYAAGTKITDPAACAGMTFSHSWNGSTDPSAAEGNAISADLAALKAAIDANNAAIDAIIAVLEKIYVIRQS